MSQNITIARALREVKKLKGRVSELTLRLQSTTSWKKEKAPDFTFAAVQEQRTVAVNELMKLKTAICVANATNALTFEGRSMTLAEAILQMGELKSDLSLVSSLNLKRGEESEHGYDDLTGRSVIQKITYESVMSEPERVEKVEALRKRIETLNDALEEANHATRVALA